MKKLFTLFCFVIFLFTTKTQAQVNFTSSSTTYTQNFNTLPNSGSPAWTDNTTPLAGWYSSKTGTTYAVDNGTSNSNNVYSYGTTSATDRALGALSTATPHRFGIRIKNNDPTLTTTSISITYTGEQWRQNNAATGANQVLTFDYQKSATAINTPTTGWTAVTALNFTAPQQSGTGLLDGNLAANRITGITSTITIALAPGEEMILRWNKTLSNSPGLAIDDLSITVNYPAGCSAPSTQASALTFTALTPNNYTVGWTNGNGTARLLIGKQTTAPTDPAQNADHSSIQNSTWTAGTNEMPPSGSTIRVLYDGTGNAVNVSALTAETQYCFNVYEWQGSHCYNLTELAGCRYTLSVEPTSHGTFSSCNAVSSSQIDLGFSAASGITNADGYIILYKAGSAPTGTPSDGQGYTVGATIGDATVAAIVNSTAATTQSITGLSGATNYYFTLIPFNWNTTSAETYNYYTTATIPSTNCTTLTPASTASDIINDVTYGLTSNFDYKLWQTASPQSSTADGLGMYNIIIRDGGATSDADALPTILNAITFNCPTFANIRSAALFTTTGIHVASVAVSSANITFTGLSGVNVTAPDNGNIELILRLSFNNTPATITDNTKIVFTITSATAASSASSSQFASANAGGAISDNDADDQNRLEVTATKLAFVQQPSNTTNGATMSPAVTVRGNDVNNIQDLDYAGAVTLTCSTPSAMTAGGGPITPVSGIATFSGIIHGTDGTYTLTASATGYTSAVSNSYVISTFTYIAGDFRPLYATDLSYNGQWEYYNGSAWVAVPDGKAPQNTSTTIGRVIINNYVSGGGSATHAYNCDFIIQNGGELNLLENDVPPVAAEMIAAGKKMEVLNGGILRVEGDIDVASTGNLIVRSGGQMFLNQNSINNTHPMWDGVELFEGGSTVTIQDWDFSASATVASLINVSTAITSNANGWKFGKLVYDVNSGTNNWAIIGGGIGIINLTENNFEITNTALSQYYITGATNKTGTNGFVVNGNMIISNGSFSFGSSYSADPFSHQFTINGNFEYNGDDTLRTHYIGASTPTGLTGYVNVKGNFTVANTAKLFGSFKATNNTVVGLNLNGTGTPIQELKIYPNVVAVPITIKSGASVLQKSYDITLNSLTSVTSDFTVETGATYNWGWDDAGTTPLIIKLPGTTAGTNRFVTQTDATLKITHNRGLMANPATDALGNVQGITQTNRVINTLGIFWYLGKTNQNTGDCFGTAANGRNIIVELANNSINLQATVAFGLTNATSAYRTVGGLLDIRRGLFKEIATTGVTAGSTGTLYMATGTGYEVKASSASNTDLIPRMDGITVPYKLSVAGTNVNGDVYGGTIYLTGDGAQWIRGSRTYANMVLTSTSIPASPNAIKYLSSNAIIDSMLYINDGLDTVTVDCIDASGNPVAFQGNGGLNMVSGRLRIKMLNTPSPELNANNPNTNYSLTGGTVEFYGSGATQQQQIRGNYRTSSPVKINYYNIDINANAANLQTFSSTPTPSQLQGVGNVDMNSSFLLTGTLNVNKPAVFRMDATDFIDNGTGTSQVINVNSGAGLLYGNEFGIKTSGTGINDGNIRTSGTRNFSTTANYGFVSNGDMVSGNGLPTTVAGLYTYRTNSIDKCTLNNGGTLITGTGSSYYNLGRQANPPTDPSYFATLSNSGLAFDVTTPFVLNSVDVYNTNAGTFQIQLLDNSGTPIYTSGTFTVTLGTGTTPYTCNLGWAIPAGTGYKIVAMSGGTAYLGRGTSSSYPYSLGSFGNITSGWIVGSGSSATSYYYFYNWGISMGILGLQNGKIVSSSSNKLVLDVPTIAAILSPANVGTIQNMGYENSYVIGLMGRNANSTSQLVFPTGSATVYGPFAVTPQNTTTQTYNGEYFSTGYGNYTLDPANSPQLDHVSLVEYWTINSSVTPSANDDAKVKLFWRTHSRVSPTNTDWSNLRVAHFDNTDWNTEGTSPTINTTSTAWGSVESNIYCANFSPFTLGTVTSNNPLPVELSSFTGNCNNDNTATLNWVTSSEINVKEFILQKTTDGFNFTQVAIVAAAGNSTLPQSYTALDADFNTEFAYYRLLIVDLDGSAKFSTTILLNCSDNTSGVNIYAVEDQGIFVKTNMAVSSNSTIEVFDVAGKRIYNEQITLPQGYYKHHLDMETILAEGIYIVRLNTGSKIYSQKVWVH